MGATGNLNAAKLANLQERKKNIEESLAKCNQELKQLCIQEADLTGTIPLEMPLEPGESPPSIRRRIGTAYQLSENLIKNSNNKDESIAELELQIQVQANMAEAALGLANEQNIGKTVRRQHMAEYQQHKMQYSALQEKLAFFKEKQSNTEQMHKQKKKPRPLEQDDNISMSDTFNKSDLRHSMRSVRSAFPNDLSIDQRYSMGHQKLSHKNSDNVYLESSNPRQDEVLASGLYRLSINGYKNYMERRENMNNMHILNYNAQQQNTPTYNQHVQQNPHFKSNSPHMPQSSHSHSQHNFAIPQLNQFYNYPVINVHYNQIQQDYVYKNANSQQYIHNLQTHRQSSPNSTKLQYYPLPNIQGQLHYKYLSNNEQTFYNHNPHQIQPHQQYEHNVMTSGLGGYWKETDSGEMIWCNSSTDSTWQRDKRFGSLDRRKNKRLHKRISPSMENKSSTLSSVPTYSEHIRTASVKSSQIVSRRSQDNRQLMRTQSLGSVGVQTVDSVWPSDDNSSCESDNRSVVDINQTNRKSKQKEWLETSLDGPVSPTHSIVSQAQSIATSVLAPEEKYFPCPPPLTPKPTTLEIPAESNPSPRIPDANVEIFNNNIPKNCTIVQAGHCKPYHEETKPFEMSDFYKYSTKFKKSPVKQDDNTKRISTTDSNNVQKNLNEVFEHGKNIHHQKQIGAIQSFSPNNANLSSEQMENAGSLSSSFDYNQISNANVAEHFSDEMNAWYKNQKFQTDNNNAGGSPSKSKSTATLV